MVAQLPQLLFALATFSYLVLLFFLTRKRLAAPEIIVLALLLSLTMDNLVLLLGDAAGDATWQRLGWLRYAVHATVLPFLQKRWPAVRLTDVGSELGPDWP